MAIGGRSSYLMTSMSYLPPAQRALDVVSPVVIYRQIGRRQSRVFIDGDMNTTKSAKAAEHRLKERVFLRTEAQPGDQIQDRPGGTLLVTAKGEWYPILLAEPQAMDAATAFQHADRAIKADREIADQLLAEGKLTDAVTARRPKGMPSRPSDRMLADDHPLVVDTLPKGFTLRDETIPPRASGQWRRRAP
jgi:hypothetical protein